MYIYNVTVNIDASVHQDWLQWMKSVHIPDVLATGMFEDNRFCQVMVDEDQGITYSIQYRIKDLEALKLYQEMYAPKLQAEHMERYRDKFVAFRTLLRIEDESSAQ
jgi:hypothetical protein